MTSREIIEQTLCFQGPPRVARTFPEPWGGDLVFAGPRIAGATDWQQMDEQLWERTDEWGNLWRRLEPHSKGEVARGALESLDRLDELPLPVVDDATDFDGARTTFQAHPELYPVGIVPGFAFNICRKLRRLDQYFMDLLESPQLLARLHDRIDDLLARWIQGLGRAGAKAIFFPEDWGTQQAPFISPELFCQEYQPRFRRLCDLARDQGMQVWIHSCGKMTPLIQPMIDAGVVCFQFDQPRLHGIETLAAWHGQATFWCPVDIQVTLPRMDGDLIADDVQAMLDQLWRGRGGFIAGYYGDNASLGLDPGWQAMACEMFVRHGEAGRYG